MARRLTRSEAIEMHEGFAFGTARPDRARVERAVRTLYASAGLAEPEVVWGESPRSTCVMADETVGPMPFSTLPGDRIAHDRAPRKTEAEVSHLVLPWLRTTSPGFWGFSLRHDVDTASLSYPEGLWRIIGFSPSVATHPSGLASVRSWFDASNADRWAILRFAQHVGWWRLHRTHAFLSSRPTALTLDHLDRPHSTTGPAIRFADGWELHAVNGIRVPSWAVTDPETISFEDIDAIHNVELRRALITLTGDRYIEDRGRLVHEDGWGRLWELEGDPGARWRLGQESERYVHVIDATAAPDGSRRRYWLRVPPSVRSAHEAVAWTFGLDAEEYAPAVET